jgi:hypothetical protein
MRRNLAVLVISAVLGFTIIFGLFMIEGPQKELTLEKVELQERIGNVASYDVYNVELSNGSEFRFSNETAGSGSLCSTNSSKESCEEKTDSGAQTIGKLIETGALRRTGKEGISTFYRPRKDICVDRINSTALDVSACMIY